MPRTVAALCLLVLATASAHAAAPLRDAFSSPDPPRSIGPLLWYHGEDDALILREIDRMHEAGIGNFTIESRPHPDYLGPKWWHDLSISIERAEQLGMQVWIFDEKWFPSGVAGGLVMQADKRFWRHYLRETSVHAKGRQSAFTLELPENESLASVVAVPAVAEPTEMRDLRAKAHLDGRTLTCPLPEGEWDVFAYTFHSDAGHHDVLSAESTAKFIELVHEPTYEHFGPYFGNTVQGFFMDEPGFYNPGDQTPWTYDFAEGFAADKGYDLAAFLPALTHPQWSQFRWARYDYTDYLTRRYAESFYRPIQEWCHAHGVRSIGHMFEHELTHWSLGAGSGHLFRTQRYFDMGGIDLVFHQVLEGSTNIDYWGMPKLGSSIAHVYDMPDDLAMDETYGASGWMTGLKRMKWLADWQMVRGINFLVPHAFDPTYPDPDCPPHFYAGGNNPQWSMFRRWSDYVNRVCYLLTGGRHIAPVAVLYTAESHWAGEADLVERTEAELLKAQVDFDLVPYDVFLGDCRFERGRIRLHGEEYSLLVLPGVEALPVRVAERLRQFTEAGGTVLTSHLMPSVSCDRGGDERVRSAMRAVFGEPADGATLWSHRTAGGGKGYFARRVTQLPYLLQDSGVTSDLMVYPRSADIRYIHRVKEGRDVFFITTESVGASYNGVVSLEAPGVPQVWDALTGATTTAPSYQRVGGRVLLPLRLAPYESLTVVFGKEPEALHVGLTDLAVIESVFRDPTGGVHVVGTAPAGSTSAYAWAQEGSRVWRGRAPVPAHPAPRQLPTDGWTVTRDGRTSVGSLGDWAKDDPYFSGSATYQREFVLSVDECASGRTLLDLGQVGEIARVWCNEQLVGELICPPYVVDLTAVARDGANALRVEVTNTLSNQRVAAGEPPHYAQVLPSGLIGPLELQWQPQVQVLLEPAAGGSPTLPVRALPPLRRGPSLADAGAVATASSTLNAQYPVEAVIDGETTGAEWEQGGGWNDATSGVWGDWVEVRLPKQQPLSGVTVTTLADDFRSGESADPGTRFTRYGLIDFDIEVWTGEAWRTAAEVRGNDLVRREVRFEPVTTDRFRVMVRRGGEDYSRIVEIELSGR